MKEAFPSRDDYEWMRRGEESTEAWDRELVEELEAPLKKILDGLRPNLEAGVYDVVIGDDASGRVPTHILNKVIGEIYQKQGREKPIVRYLAGSTGFDELDDQQREQKRQRMTEQIERIKRDVGTQGNTKKIKALIVTDSVLSGQSMRVLVQALALGGVEADVASVGVTDSKSWTERKVEAFIGPATLYGGHEGTPGIYWSVSGAKALSGVMKHPKQLFAESRRKHPYTDISKDQERVNFARMVGSEVAERLLTAYYAHEMKKAA